MKNQQAVVEQILQNLAFEVEAVPKNNKIQDTSIAQNAPLNVKIRVRKKDNIDTQHDISAVVDDNSRNSQKVQPVSSNQTIMNFDVFVEDELEKKPSRNLRKHVVDMLKPGMCLGPADDDNYSYMPCSSYSANITDSTVATRSDGTLKQTFTLTKNIPQVYTVSTPMGGQKWFFGKCKPGGCLDPPFSEDKYAYKPSARSEPERTLTEPNISPTEELNNGDDIDINRKYSKSHDEDVKSNGRHSSIFDGGLFKKKRKSSDKPTNTKLPDKTSSVLNLYQVESADNSLSTKSNSLITYPSKMLSDLKISDDKTIRSRGPSEDKTRRSFNDHSEPYFIPPKGINRIKNNDTLNQTDSPKHRSFDISENIPKEPFKMPVPIPIPVPLPLKSKKNEPEVRNDDILNTQDNANITEVGLPPQQLQVESITGDTIDVHPVKSLEIETPDASELIEQSPTHSDKNLDQANLQPNKKMDSGSKIIDAVQPNELMDTEPLKLPFPVPVPLNLTKTDSAATIDLNMQNDYLQISDIKLTQSKESIGITETIPHIIKDTSFEDSKDMNQSIISENIPRKSEPTDESTPNSQYRDKKDTATNVSTVEKDIKRGSEEKEIRKEIVKPENQNNIECECVTAGDSTHEKSDLVTTTTSPEEAGSTDYQRILRSNIPILQNNKSPETSIIKDKTKESDNAEKLLNEVENTDIDLINNKDKNKKSLRSGRENEKDIVNDKISQSYNDKDNKAQSTKPIIDDEIYSGSQKFKNNGSMSYITAPVIINKTDPNANFKPLKEVCSETNLLEDSLTTNHDFDPINALRSKKLDEDNVTQSSVSNELFGIKSFIYDSEEYIPSRSPVKNTEITSSVDKRVILPVVTGIHNAEIILKSPRTSGELKKLSDDLGKKLIDKSNVRSTSVLSSATVLKSAMKKDTISVALGFHSYINDKNERILRTFDAASTPTRHPNDTLTVIKSQIRVSSNEIRIPVDSDHDISIQIKKPSTHQHVSISESEFVNVRDNSGITKQRSPVQVSDAEIKDCDVTVCNKIVEGDVTNDNVIDLYEQELVPLQMIIKNLRDEIDVLAAQQLRFQNQIFCPNKLKLPRLIHSNKKCVGCVRK